jgi:hypothetical protein
MVKKKTLRLKNITLTKRKIKKSRKYYKGGFLTLLVAINNMNTPKLQDFIIDYFNSQRGTLQQNYNIETPNQLFLQIRGYQAQPHDALYDDVNRKYEEYMMAL